MDKHFDSLIQYYIDIEKDYSFSNKLPLPEIQNIKSLVKEKRNQYSNAPIGHNIFDFIKESESALDFQFLSFESSDIDAMLYIEQSQTESAWIIINSNRPFVKQIFAAAHEFYHYIKDYEEVKKKPFICQFNSIQDLTEQKANKFAAELLLPTEALNNEVANHLVKINCAKLKKSDFVSWAMLSMLLTVKYELPLKAVLYRLYEEDFIHNIDEFLTNYEFLKQYFIECKIFKNKTEVLFSNNNPMNNESDTISRMINAFNCGMVTYEQVINDAKVLLVDEENVRAILDDIQTANMDTDVDDNNDDEEWLFDVQRRIKQKMEE